MHKFMVALLLSMFSLAASAQEMGASAPKAEIFGGYQYTRFDGGLNTNGWDTAVNGNLNNCSESAEISAALTTPRVASALTPTPTPSGRSSPIVTMRS